MTLDAPPTYATFQRSLCSTFRKTNEKFGGLSNMAGGYLLEVTGVPILTSEALYQACRFPHLPQVQGLILKEKSPMAAKMKSKPSRSQSRPDWDLVRVDIMRWCLQVKLVQHWQSFGGLLRETGQKRIVEESSKDWFWGAVAPKQDPNLLVGDNVLGSLLEEMRELSKAPRLQEVESLGIPDFLLLGHPIQKVTSY